MFTPSTCHDLIQKENDTYEATLPKPDPTWPIDVQVLVRCIHKHLFEMGLTIRKLRQRYGLTDNNISTRFNEHMGISPKAYMLMHRFEVAKRLLGHSGLRHAPIFQIAMAVGYERHDVFSARFKKREGCTPTAYRVLLGD